MLKPVLVKTLLNTLRSYEHPLLPLSTTSMNHLAREEGLVQLILSDTIRFECEKLDRPELPINKQRKITLNLARFENYRHPMQAYLAQYGMKIDRLHAISIPALEAIANYAESSTKKGGSRKKGYVPTE